LPRQPDAFARIVVIFLRLRQHGHQPTSRPTGSRTQFAGVVGSIRDSDSRENCVN
jgi:hypothetical protein